MCSDTHGRILAPPPERRIYPAARRAAPGLPDESGVPIGLAARLMRGCFPLASSGGGEGGGEEGGSFEVRSPQAEGRKKAEIGNCQLLTPLTLLVEKRRAGSRHRPLLGLLCWGLLCFVETGRRLPFHTLASRCSRPLARWQKSRFSSSLWPAWHWLPAMWPFAAAGGSHWG